MSLGASSTFGYYSRDSETYPAQLERILNESCGKRRFEVINLGIPHLTSREIRALFEAEALPLGPDVVTFYEGVNDSLAIVDALKRVEKSRIGIVRYLRRRLADLAQWSVQASFLVYALDGGPRGFPRSVFEAEVEPLRERFVANVAAIETACRERGVLFLAAKQQAQSLLLPRSELRGVSYAEEVALVEEKAAATGKLTWHETSFLAHDVLVEGLERWAGANGVPFVDAVAVTDRDRDVLLSAMHLSPRGNRLVAEALAREIRARLCSTGDPAS